MVSQRPATIVEVVATACIVEEMLGEQYGPLNKKEKTKTEATSSTNPKLTQNQNQQGNKNGGTTKGRGMAMAMATKIGITTNYSIRIAKVYMMRNA